MPLSRVCSTVSTSPRRTVNDKPWLIFTPASAALAPDFLASASTYSTTAESRARDSLSTTAGLVTSALNPVPAFLGEDRETGGDSGSMKGGRNGVNPGFLR